MVVCPIKVHQTAVFVCWVEGTGKVVVLGLSGAPQPGTCSLDGRLYPPFV